jgi:hypothetical protein
MICKASAQNAAIPSPVDVTWRDAQGTGPDIVHQPAHGEHRAHASLARRSGQAPDVDAEAASGEASPEAARDIQRLPHRGAGPRKAEHFQRTQAYTASAPEGAHAGTDDLHSDIVPSGLHPMDVGRDRARALGVRLTIRRAGGLSGEPSPTIFR